MEVKKSCLVFPVNQRTHLTGGPVLSRSAHGSIGRLGFSPHPIVRLDEQVPVSHRAMPWAEPAASRSSIIHRPRDQERAHLVATSS